MSQSIQCTDCGKFMSGDSGSWADIYDFVGMQLSHTHFRCDNCTKGIGPVNSNARPADGDMSGYEGCHESIPDGWMVDGSWKP